MGVVGVRSAVGRHGRARGHHPSGFQRDLDVRGPFPVPRFAHRVEKRLPAPATDSKSAAIPGSAELVGIVRDLALPQTVNDQKDDKLRPWDGRRVPAGAVPHAAAMGTATATRRRQAVIHGRFGTRESIMDLTSSFENTHRVASGPAHLRLSCAPQLRRRRVRRRPRFLCIRRTRHLEKSGQYGR